jgi:hypothetical protein
LTPPAPQARLPLELTFKVTNPRSGAPVSKFDIVHERPFHMFIVSQDLNYFIHDHPVLQPDATFKYTANLPKAGLYRVLADFYPSDGTPQLIPRTVILPGGELKTTALAPNVAPKHAQNLDVELTLQPPQPVAGATARLLFQVTPEEGLEKYLGAWAHMLIASDDLIDLIHDHPFVVGTRIQFNITFPRARLYRVWVQFQRNGVVNTVAFTIPVARPN